MESAFSKEDLRQRIRWYIGLRWFFVLAIGFSGSLPQLFQEGLVSQVVLNMSIVGGMLVINAIFLFISHLRSLSYLALKTLAVSQLVLDVSIITGAIYFNGGIENIIFCLYVIPIVMSGALLGRFSVYLTGLAAAIIYDFMLLFDFLGKLTPENILAPQVHADANYVVQTMFIAPAMLITITVLTDFVSRLIRERSDLAARLHTISVEHSRTEAVLQSMGSALVAIDTEGKIELVNDSFEKLTGWSRNEVVGVDINSVLPLLDENGKAVEAANRPLLKMLAKRSKQQRPGIEHLSQFYLARKDGTIFPFVSAISQVILNDQVIGALSVFEDATSTRKIEQLKTNFVALASHQLKTPLGEIQGYAQNMMAGITGPPTKEQVEYLKAIEEITARCRKLINDLLDISVIEQGNLLLSRKAVDLHDVIKEATDIYHERLKRDDLHFKIKEAEHPLIVLADQEKLVEVLGNVFTNAVRYTKPHGIITIQTRRRGKHAEILVSDQGPGMEAAVIEGIFHKNDVLSAAPKAEGGTGIGLYLAKQLMSLQKGDISVVSSTNKGTTVALKIPLKGDL